MTEEQKQEIIGQVNKGTSDAIDQLGTQLLAQIKELTEKVNHLNESIDAIKNNFPFKP